MGSVFLAREVALGRVVAVKVLARELASNEQFRQRFEREARAAAGLSHPSVVQVYTVGEAPGDPPLPYIIMQYVEGAPLDGLLEEGGRFPEQRARRVLRDVAAGLAAAHTHDLVHRDIKPANILIEHASGRALIADFGISAALSPRAIGGAEPLSDEGVVLGTLPYMSPEQTYGEPPSPASDVYSLGVMAYEVLSGSLPYSAHSPQSWMHAHRSQTATPLRELRAGVSDDLVRLIERCLAKEPGARPAAAELARELLPSAEDEILWPPPGMVELPRLGRRLRLTALGLLGAMTALLAVLALRVQGTHAAAGWWRAWSSGGLISAVTAPAGWLVVVWQAALLASAALTAGALALLTFLVLRSWGRLRALRRHGWRRETVLDAMADPDGRSGLLLKGAGEFATLPLAERDRIRRYRRVAHSALLLAAGWVALLLAAWAVAIALGTPLQPRGGPPVNGVMLLVTLLPVAALLLPGATALLSERRVAGAAWRRQHSGSFAVPSDTGGEEIAAWYAELPGDPGPAPARSLPVAVWGALQLGLGGLAVWTLLSLAALTVATLLAGRLARRVGQDTADVAAWAEHPETHRQLADALGVLHGYRPPESPPAAPADSLGVALAALPAYPSQPERVLGSLRPGLLDTALVVLALRRAASLPPDTLRLLGELAGHPRTLRLRQAARRGRILLPAEGDSGATLRTAVEANAAGAVLAVARGNFAEAASRLGENLAIGAAALAAPGSYWPETGLRLLQSRAVLPLAELERLRGDATRESELHAAARALAEASDRFGPSWMQAGIGLAGDPRDLALLLALQADSVVPPGKRNGALQASGNAVCLNPREWLSGADPARRAKLGNLPLIPQEFGERGVRGLPARIRYCAGL